MSIIHDPKDSSTYQIHNFDKEIDFEKVVVQLSIQIFGDSTFYIDVKKRMKGCDIISIPDGYLIDATDINNPSLYIIENEIVSHDPFKHIGIQLLKFATVFEEAQVDVRRFLMEEISKVDSSLSEIEKLVSKSNFRNVDNFLDHAVYKPFRALVIIDEARPELHNVLGKINADISVIELKSFVNEKGLFIYQFDTLYDESDDLDSGNKTTETPLTKEERVRRRRRRAKCDTIVVPARKEGFERVFIGENRWYAIRIGAAMKERIKYIAAYQKSPVSAVTHIAKIKEIKPYKDTGKYEIIFEQPAQKISSIKLNNPSKSPQGPVYIEHSKISTVECFDELLE